jgi:hypothetical protein
MLKQELEFAEKLIERLDLNVFTGITKKLKASLLRLVVWHRSRDHYAFDGIRLRIP